ncbi:MAG: DUF4404 family protein [Planctomycetales bacterium]|nr:DUF4404 family protein [Planctomycetales bacterium]
MRQNLEETLRDLHEQLAHAQDLDAEQVELLRAAVTEIEKTLDRTDVNSANLAEQLQEATERFSGSHPVLVQTVGRIADLLQQMGI